jgi:hypothetical protein
VAEAEAYERALGDAVRQALAAYPPDAAAVREGRAHGVWSVEVTPVNPAAARCSVAYAGGDEATVAFGGTHAYLWDDDPLVLAARVSELLSAACAGRVEEAGRRGDAFARVVLADGRRVGVGAAHLPWPWRWRRVRRYEPISAG